MKSYFLKLLILFFCTGIISSFSADAAVQSSKLIGSLYSSLNGSDPEDQYLAALFLGELPLSDGVPTNELDRQLGQTEDRFRRLLLTYILARRTEQKNYEESFIDLYPSGEEQHTLWDLQERNFPFDVASPLQSYLFELSTNSDKALIKLASGIPFARGIHSEILSSQLVELHSYQPNRIDRLLAAWPRYIEYIRMAEQF